MSENEETVETEEETETVVPESQPEVEAEQGTKRQHASSLRARFLGQHRQSKPRAKEEVQRVEPPAARAPAKTVSRAQAKRDKSALRRGRSLQGGTHMIKHSKRKS